MLNWRRFRSQKDFLGVAREFIRLGRRENQSPNKSGPVANVVIGVVLGKAEHVLAQEMSLLRICQVKFCGECNNLKLDYICLKKEKI